MTTLIPRSYGGFPTYQFNPPNQINYRYYNGGYHRQKTFFPPHYPTQPLYQPPINRTEGYPAPVANQFRSPGLGTQLITFFNELDAQYRQEQYLRKIQKAQRQYWKLQANNMPPPMYPAPVPLNYSPGTVYQYEKETKYVPFPVYIGAGAGSYGASGNTTYNIGSSMLFGTGGGMDLPPKIRVIFIPTGQSFSQQPYTSSLAMPPFLYNRMSQPLCSFPLPPPLPQLGSLPLTPAVQQMVIQRYSNPVAVLPYTPNWETPPLMMSGYPSASQQQHQYMPPMPAFPSLPPAPQAFIPPPVLFSAPTAALPSLPPAPQACIPPPVPSFAPILAPPALPPAPQTFIPPPIPSFAPISALPAPPPAPQAYIPPPVPSFAPLLALPALPPAPQTFIPPPVPSFTPISALPAPPSASQAYIPPPTMSAPLPMLPPSSLPDANPVSSVPEYSYSGYPSMCRACPPAPPPLNISVTGHCWVQHCCACHHVPTPISNPNVRPTGGRITPLLRHPTVPQYIPEQTKQEYQQYFHTNAPVMMRPWLRKTPPLPPGAVVISDKYIHKNDSYPPYNSSRRQKRQNEGGAHAKHRSTTVTSRTIPAGNMTTIKNNRSVSSGRTNNNTHNNPGQQQGPINSKSATSTTSSSGLSGEYEKVTLRSPETKQDTIPQQLTREARNINLQYKYQPQELPIVYLVNHYLKSNSETSTLSSNVETPSTRSPSFVKEQILISSPSNDPNSIQNVPNFEQKDKKPPRPPSHSKKVKEKLLIIREFQTSSPSTISTISSNLSFDILNKEDDSISTTSTLKPDKLEEDDVLHRNIF